MNYEESYVEDINALITNAFRIDSSSLRNASAAFSGRFFNGSYSTTAGEVCSFAVGEKHLLGRANPLLLLPHHLVPGVGDGTGRLHRWPRARRNLTTIYPPGQSQVLEVI